MAAAMSASMPSGVVCGMCVCQSKSASRVPVPLAAGQPGRAAEAVDGDRGQAGLGEPLGQRHVVGVQAADVGQQDHAGARPAPAGAA